jgi:hypothetical protein
MPDMIRMIQDIQRWKKRDRASDHITVYPMQGEEKLRDIAPKPHRKIKKTRACRFLVVTNQNKTIFRVKTQDKRYKITPSFRMGKWPAPNR